VYVVAVMNVYLALKQTYAVDAIGSGGFGVEMHTLDPEVAGTGPNRLCEAFKAHFEQSLGSTLAPVEAALPFLRWLPTTRRRIVDTNEVATARIDVCPCR
jgi:hypothetical protein